MKCDPRIARAAARQGAQRLLAEGHQVIGIDPRGWPSAPEQFELQRWTSANGR